MGNEANGKENGPSDLTVRGNSCQKLKGTTGNQRLDNSF
jgi:hypothetical protein